MSSLLAYLIDFDGTLADTSEANYQAYAQALQEVGVAVSREKFDREAFGRNWRQFLPQFLAEAGNAAEPAAVAARKVVLYANAGGLVHFNEALIALLAERAHGIKLALVTSASSANVKSALAARPDLLAMFDVVVTGDDVKQHKPHPEGFALAARMLGVTPAQCLVFEDSDIGVASALAFGAPVLRVSMNVTTRVGVS